MPPSERDLQDFEFLSATAEAGKAMGISNFLHLDQPVGIWNYIRIANRIAAEVPAGRLLDWGCGLGQMTYLLQRRGFRVTAYDVDRTVESLPDLPLTRHVSIIRGTHPTTLPFPDSAFDIVLSCGVLEHVDEYSEQGNEVRALREIHRVLAPEGHLPIFQLPQQLAWQEAITRTLKVGYSHPRRFTERGIRSLLDRTGFRVDSLRRYNMLPKNVTGLPAIVRDAYGRQSRVVHRADDLLSRVPVLNRLAGVLELIAQRV